MNTENKLRCLTNEEKELTKRRELYRDLIIKLGNVEANREPPKGFFKKHCPSCGGDLFHDIGYIGMSVLPYGNGERIHDWYNYYKCKKCDYEYATYWSHEEPLYPDVPEFVGI